MYTITYKWKYFNSDIISCLSLSAALSFWKLIKEDSSWYKLYEVTRTIYDENYKQIRQEIHSVNVSEKYIKPIESYTYHVPIKVFREKETADMSFRLLWEYIPKKYLKIVDLSNARIIFD